MPHPDPLLAEWIEDHRGLIRPNTLETYTGELERFRRVEPSSNPDAHAVRRFILRPIPKGGDPTPATIRVRIAVLKCYCDWLRGRGTLAADPLRTIRRPRSRALPAVRTLESMNDVRRLLAAIPTRPRLHIRNRAIILTGIITGLRWHELAQLNRKTLSTGTSSPSGTIYYTVTVKGGHTRKRELPAEAFAAICLWLETRGTSIHTIPEDEPFFEITRGPFATSLAGYCERARLPRLTPHGLRHTAARLQYNRTRDVEAVASFLGHRDLATTHHYLRRIEGENDPTAAAIATEILATPVHHPPTTSVPEIDLSGDGAIGEVIAATEDEPVLAGRQGH